MTAAPAAAPARTLPTEVDVAVIGAGFGGLGMAIRLRQEGLDDFVVLERSSDVGGTWQANTYPGAQCDIPSTLYSFSFAPKADWTHSYPEQPQILDYLRDCADRFGVRDRVHTDCEVLEADWQADERRWLVRTACGDVRARVLVAAPGLLSEPCLPDIAGLDRFDGPTFHTTAWDHDHDLTGKRVALVGTGASAIQIGPRLQPSVARLTVFQRTPAWVLPHTNRPIGPLLLRLYRALPETQRIARAGAYALREGAFGIGMTYDPRLLKGSELVATAYRRLKVRDPELRAKLTPTDALGCKRVLLTSDWYPTLTSENVELVTDPIVEVTERAVVTADEREHEVDALVLATGFTPTELPIATRVRGRAGETLSKVWGGSPQAYLGTTVAGFPNLFVLYGPNVNLGHNSIVYMLESQIHYVLDALRVMREQAVDAVEVREDVQRAYNAQVQRRLAGSVWNSGCSSWYLDANGHNSTMWPGFTFAFRRRTRRFSAIEYHLDRVPRDIAVAI